MRRRSAFCTCCEEMEARPGTFQGGAVAIARLVLPHLEDLVKTEKLYRSL